MPNMVIDNDVVNTVINTIENYIKPVIFGCAMFWFVLSGLVVIGLYSLLAHWIMSAIYKAPYRQTLRLSTYSYVIFNALTIFLVLNHTFWLGFLLALVLNFVVNIAENKQPKDEKQA